MGAKTTVLLGETRPVPALLIDQSLFVLKPDACNVACSACGWMWWWKCNVSMARNGWVGISTWDYVLFSESHLVVCPVVRDSVGMLRTGIGLNLLTGVMCFSQQAATAYVAIVLKGETGPFAKPGRTQRVCSHRQMVLLRLHLRPGKAWTMVPKVLPRAHRGVLGRGQSEMKHNLTIIVKMDTSWRARST